MIWDELPWALQKIARTEGEPVVVDGAYRFRFDLIRRWWRCDLGLD